MRWPPLGGGNTSGTSLRRRAAIIALSSSLSFSNDRELNFGRYQRSLSRRSSAIRTEVVSSHSHAPSVPSKCSSSSLANCSAVTFLFSGRAATRSPRTTIPRGITISHTTECRKYDVRIAGTNRTSSKTPQPEAPDRSRQVYSHQRPLLAYAGFQIYSTGQACNPKLMTKPSP